MYEDPKQIVSADAAGGAAMVDDGRLLRGVEKKMKAEEEELLRVAGLGYCVPAVPINRSTRTGPIRSCDDYGTLFTPPMIRRVG
ncbi:hypothetical protein P3T76_012955 [Phytophthora citrophthora]|uniref:Uncharacterized protein n=1 Tax=Phytophthora citrophthora TaxID=4793 RepID=A0AAD9LCP8_9STRA|nr:hypothetical protein P3T76_012955 [Phytophthora citrophthora]